MRPHVRGLWKPLEQLYTTISFVLEIQEIIILILFRIVELKFNMRCRYYIWFLLLLNLLLFTLIKVMID